MKIILTLLLLLSFHSIAQINNLQDDSAINWKKIENQYFEIIYPDHVEDQAQYIFQLLNHYREQVSETYRYKAEKISVVLRSNSADPNGFVTLTPRRSEWFMSTAFSPFVGSLEWYQTLAVHEYRHVVQFDSFNRSNTKIGYALGGETFLSLLLNITVPNWFFEGDAVWIETVRSNAGRGRSPRFSARLKALTTNDYPLTLDQLLAGDFSVPTPNHYVYGYFFVTRAIVLYGNDFWYHVTSRAMDEPLNPFALYDAFYEITGISFDQFFKETINDLKQHWGKNPTLIPLGEYSSKLWPKWDQGKLHYLVKDLDHQLRLIEIDENKKEKTLTELNTYPTMSKVDLKNGNLIYVQNRPHHRYGFKNYSDLFLYNINENKHIRLTKGKRFYHPQFHPSSSKILATEYNSKNQWSIVIMDLKGKTLQVIPSTKDFKLIEAVWKDDENLAAISLNPKGLKQIVNINIKTKRIRPISPLTRNNIFALHFDEILYFEADDLGAVNIFAYNFLKEEYYKCSDEFIAAGHPSTSENKLLFSTRTVNGSEIKSLAMDCRPIVKADIFKNYLGDTPSDNYTKTKPIDVKDFNHLNANKSETYKYSEYKSAFIPHSWSFLGGRGYEIAATTSNILGTLAFTGYVGQNSEEGKPYVGIGTRYAKYYPIFSFGVDQTKRKVKINQADVEWTEVTSSLQMTLPYIYQHHLYNGTSFLSLIADHIQVTEKDQVREIFELNDQQLTGLGFNLGASYTKQKLAREIFPRHGIAANYFYQDIKTAGNSESLSYLGNYNLNFFTPGLKNLHGLKVSAAGEYRPADKSLYRQQREYIPIIGYSFSRGYAYEFVPRFNKYSLDYAFTLGYPNTGYKEWIYFNRIYTQLFFDYTEAFFERGQRDLNSYGIEIYFDSLTFRKFPINYGLRTLKRTQDGEGQFEFFITL